MAYWGVKIKIFIYHHFHKKVYFKYNFFKLKLLTLQISAVGYIESLLENVHLAGLLEFANIVSLEILQFEHSQCL